MGWQAASGCNWRGLIGADAGRFERVVGGAFGFRKDRHCTTEVAIAVDALNRVPDLGRPGHVWGA